MLTKILNKPSLEQRIELILQLLERIQSKNEKSLRGHSTTCNLMKI